MTGTPRPLAILWESLKTVWDEIFPLTVCNVLWLLLSLPIVTAPASCAALYYVADMAARQKAIYVRDFFDGFRQYFVKGSLLGVANLLLGAIIATNILFYGNMEAAWAQVVRGIWIVVAVFFAVMQVYLFPMLVLQIEPRVLWALRSAIMMVLAQPVFTLIIFLEVVGLILLSVILIVPFFFVSMSAIAVLCCAAATDRMAYIRSRSTTPANDAPQEESK
jgi:uncharacterized membrane protein YesL